jgi:integrase
MESLRLARKKSTLANFSFHDCRHFFISYCVMSGIDYMTIARWVGHKDGGVLIGKVYGHLNNEHTQAQVARLNFSQAQSAKS